MLRATEDPTRSVALAHARTLGVGHLTASLGARSRIERGQDEAGDSERRDEQAEHLGQSHRALIGMCQEHDAERHGDDADEPEQENGPQPSLRCQNAIPNSPTPITIAQIGEAFVSHRAAATQRPGGVDRLAPLGEPTTLRGARRRGRSRCHAGRRLEELDGGDQDVERVRRRPSRARTVSVATG